MPDLAEIKIKKLIDECYKHQYRINSAYSKIEYKLPLTEQVYKNLTDEDIEHIDQFIFRFSKLQDAIGQRLFKAMLIFLEEDVETLPFIDVLNKLEKLRLLESTEQWKQLREIRNAIAHEYDDSPQLMAQVLNTVFDARIELFAIYENFKKTYKARISN